MRIRRSLILLAILAAASGVAAQPAPKTAAVVNGEAITERQVLEAAAADLSALDAGRPQNGPTSPRQRLEILHRALDAIVEDRLLAAEAAREHVAKRQIIEAEIESNISVPTDDEVAAYYERNKSRITVPREQALRQITQQLIDQSRRLYHDALFGRLKKAYGFRSYLEPLRTDVATDGHPARGPLSAPVTIVEFSDFECPFCGGLFPTLKAVERNYPDRVRIVYRQFPLKVHPHAQKAAEASLCANEQGRFWEMHDSMFGNQEELTVDALKKRAADLAMDTAAFNTCLDSGRQAAAVAAEIGEGSKAGVSGTPTMFINGRILVGNRPYADIREMIEDELQSQRFTFR